MFRSGGVLVVSKKTLIWVAVAILGVNAILVFNSAEAYSVLGRRTRMFNRSAAIRLDAKDCRQRYENRSLCCQCVFQFEKHWSDTTIKATGHIKIEAGESGLTTIRGEDGLISDGYNTIAIQDGHVYVNDQLLEITRPTIFLLRRDRQIFADQVDAY